MSDQSFITAVDVFSTDTFGMIAVLNVSVSFAETFTGCQPHRRSNHEGLYFV